VLPRATRLLVIVPVTAFLTANAIFLYMEPTTPIFPLLRVAYDFDTLILPALFALCGSLVFLLKGDRQMRRRVALGLISFAFLCVGVRVYATHIEPRRLQIREASMPGSFSGKPLRILHISDIQSDAIGSWERRVVDEMKTLEPDLIIHTGDLLHPIPPSSVESERPKLELLMNELNPRFGKFAVDGDSDDWFRYTDMKSVVGLERLSSRSVTIDAGGTRIHLLGLSLPESATPDRARAVVERWMLGHEPDDLTIVAGHRPDFVLGLEGIPVDLVLAGHTHGGQVRIPFYGPILTFTEIPRDWARGFRRIGHGWLNVSAGIGTEHKSALPAIRINCPPEMTLVTVGSD
jgi:predicted MPP superfamily phosphohydrolase